MGYAAGFAAGRLEGCAAANVRRTNRRGQCHKSVAPVDYLFPPLQAITGLRGFRIYSEI